MKKKIFDQVSLTCVFQNANSDFATSVPGILSPTEEGVLFQETIPKKRELRNSRLYEGKLINLVRRKDGNYYPFVKGYKAGGPISMQDYAYCVYSEITEALKSIV